MRKRIEILFPIMDEEHKQYLKDCLALALADNVKAREQTAAGSYHYVKDGKQRCESQLLILDYTSGKLKQKPSFTAPLKQKWITIEKKDDKVILDQNAT